MNSNKKMLVIYLIVITLLFSYLPTVFAGEVRYVNDNDSVPGWTIGVLNVDGGGYIDSSEHSGGNNSMKLYNNTVKTGDDTYLMAYYPIQVKKGSSYRYGFKVKAKNANNVTTMMDWNSPRANLLPTGGTAGWREFEFTYNHTTDANIAYLRIVLDTKTEAIWFDDMYYYEVGDSSNTNLIKNPSFEDTAANIPREFQDKTGTSKNIWSADGRNLVSVQYKQGIQVDGNTNEWGDMAPIELSEKLVYNGDLSVRANIKYAYDEEYFYFCTTVDDNVHYPVLEGQYWTGDGIQFTLCGANDTYGEYYAYSYDPKSNTSFTNGYDNLKYSFKRDGTTSIYEVAIPWKDCFANGKPDEALFCLIVNDNDDDGYGRKGCVMLSEGIASYKGSDKFPALLMTDRNVGLAAWLSGDKECLIGEETQYSIDLFNSSNKDLDVTLKSKKGEFNETIKIPANSSVRHDFQIIYSDIGEETFDVTVLNGEIEKPYSINTAVYADEKTTKDIIAKHRAEYAELTPLLKQCKDKGLHLDYDEINYSILGHFVSYIEENLKNGDTVRVEQQDKALTELYEKTKSNLTAYLDGTKTPLSAPTYVTSDISVKGKHFEATVDNNGKLEHQPVFFVGTGHWAPSRKDIPILSKFGFNAIQPEVGGWDCLKLAAAVRDWSVVSNGYKCTNESDTTEKKNGEYSLKLSSNAEDKGGYWDITQTVKVKPNTTYEYGLSAKATNAKHAWFTIDSNWAIRNGIEGTYDWKDFSYKYTTGPKQTELTFYIIVQNKADAIWIDDAYLREEGSNKNILINSGFETVNDPNAYWETIEPEIESLEKDFDLMAQYNLSGVFSTAPHYIPWAFLNEHPELKSSSNQPQFSTQTILDHPEVKEYFETYYRTVMPHLAGKPAFDSVVLMNEPVYYTYWEEYYLPIFQDEMKKKYGNIKALNEKWGTEYADFNKIEMPSEVAATAQFYDWRVFNDEVIPNFNKRASSIIKEYDPNVLTQTKMMQTMRSNTISRIDGSNNWEAIAPTVDINGCDGWTFYELRNDYSIRAQDMFYDYQTSVKNAPTYNTEDHIIEDGNANEDMKFISGETEYNIATLWQSAIHGKCGSIIWFWDREQRSARGGNLHNTLLTERPETVAAIGKMTLDLNRLSREIVSIIESQAKVGMLYTLNNVPYADDYMNVMYTTYSKLGENGQKTQFIVESAMENLNDVKCLIVPHVVSIKDDSFDAIRAFADKGGKVIILGKDSLTKDEYGKERDADKIAALMPKAEIVDLASVGTTLDAASISKIGDTISNMVQTENYSDISVIDKETGKPLTDCEYLYSQYEGKYIVNLCTYRDDNREVEIYVNGKKTENFTDLISTETYKGSASVKAYTPMLIRIEG